MEKWIKHCIILFVPIMLIMIGAILYVSSISLMPTPNLKWEGVLEDWGHSSTGQSTWFKFENFTKTITGNYDLPLEKGEYYKLYLYMEGSHQIVVPPTLIEVRDQNNSLVWRK